MSMIATKIDPQGAVRIFFDLCAAPAADRRDEVRIARVIEQAAAQKPIIRAVEVARAA